MSDYKYGILLQGKINLWTKDIIAEYKTNFPDAHIVLSTWNTENVSKIDCDTVQSESPLPTYPHGEATNHQIIGVNAGLKKINAEIILKCRTDQFIHNKEIFQLFNKNCSLEKIMIADVGTTLNEDYRASDFCQIATSKVLNDFWNNIPLYDGKYANPSEIYLTKNYVVNFIKDTKPWSKIMNKYFHVMGYHSDFQIEFERLDKHRIYSRYYENTNHIEQIKNHHKKFRVKSYFFQSQKSRMIFSQKYVGEKVLLCTYGINTQYTSSKLALDSKCREIWHRKNFENNLTQRRFDSEKNIECKKEVDIKDVSENSFDTILSFEEIQFHNDPDSLIKSYKKLLKSNGILIISVSNDDSNATFEVNTQSLSKEELLKIIKANFTIIDEYYQGNQDSIINEDEKIESLPEKLGNTQEKDTNVSSFIEGLDTIFSKNIGQNGNQSSLKIILKRILNVLDNRKIFYKLYLQPTVIKLREKKYGENIIDFTPKIIDNKQTGLYFLIIAKKIID